jgi:hypothetical protein
MTPMALKDLGEGTTKSEGIAEIMPKILQLGKGVLKHH